MINPMAVYALYDNVVSTTGDVEETFVAFDKDGKEVAVDFSDIDAWVDPNAYINQRMAEYPPWEAQLDKIYHSGIDAWKADIKKIKDKYPKPE